MPDQEPSSRLARVNPVVFILAAMLVVFVVVGALVLATRGGESSRAGAPAGHHMYAGHVNPTAQKGELQVLVGDYWFKPSSHRVRAGVYRFSAHNYGVTQHDVMVERMPIKFSAPGAPVDEAAPYGVDGLWPGMTKRTRVMLTAGRWEVFCSVPGHYQAGQHQVITVYGRMPRGMPAPKAMGMGGEPSGDMGTDAS